MRPGGAGGDHGMVGTFEPVLNRDITCGKIDQASRNEERAHPARPLLSQKERGLLDALQAADARADEHAGADLVLVGCGLPARVGQRLLGRAHGIDNKVINFAQLLRLHPIACIEGAVAAVATCYLAGDLAGEVGDVEVLDALGGIVACRQTLPRDLDPAAARRKETEACDDNTSHLTLSRDPQWESLGRAGWACCYDDATRPERDEQRKVQAAVFFSKNLMASPTVRIVSAASSGISQPNSSSKAMTSSTVSRLSAPRSSMKLALSVTLSGSTPRCSTTIFFTRSPMSLIFQNLVRFELA